jgi:hypothetical protein
VVMIGDGNRRATAMIGCHAESDEPVARSAHEQGKRSDNGAATTRVAHDEPKIEAARMNQQALEDIGVAA